MKKILKACLVFFTYLSANELPLCDDLIKLLATNYLIDYSALKDSKSIRELYGSLAPFNSLARVNKKLNAILEHCRLTLNENLESKSLQTYFDDRLLHLKQTRHDNVNNWCAPYIKFDYYYQSTGQCRGFADNFRIIDVPHSSFSMTVLNPREHLIVQSVYNNYNVHEINNPLEFDVNIIFQKNTGIIKKDVLLLHLFCMCARLSNIKKLIQWGADPNAKNNSGKTALLALTDMYTTCLAELSIGIERYAEIIQLLLNNGASIDSQDNQGFTALMNIMQKHVVFDDNGGKRRSNFILIDILLGYHPDINLKDNQWNTVLMHALQHKHGSLVINKLLNSGAKVNIRNNKGQTPLYLALNNYSQHDSVIDIIRSKTSNKYKRLTFAQNNLLREVGYLFSQYFKQK